MTIRMEEDAHGEAFGKGREMRTPSGHTTVPVPPHVNQPEALQTPSFGSLRKPGGSIT